MRSPRVSDVVLLDGFYGGTQAWERWLQGHASRLMLVVDGVTASRSAQFCARAKQVTCENPGLSHMGIVTSGTVIPRVLRAAAARPPQA